MMWGLWQPRVAIASVGILCLVGACQRIKVPQPPSAYASDTPESLQSNVDFAARWIVSASEAQDLAQQGAIILDVRKRRWPQIPGASGVTWQQFSQRQKPYRGKLQTSDAKLTQQLQSLGISSHTAILVVGETHSGWGEEGRIVWMLRTLGHRQSYMVDGGATVLTQVNRPSQAVGIGDFMVQRDDRWTLDQSELESQLKSGTLKLIDSREPREYAGQTPYGESRGGHLDRAQNLYFKDFLDADGTLLPHAELIAKLERLGLTPADQIVVYCTGGIRSGWLTTLLVSLGYQAQNYPGSMWEWSASPAEDYPLQTIAP